MKRNLIKHKNIINKHCEQIQYKIKKLKWYEFKKKIKYNIIKNKLEKRRSYILDIYIREIIKRDKSVEEIERLKRRAIIRATIEELFEDDKKNKTQ